MNEPRFKGLSEEDRLELAAAAAAAERRNRPLWMVVLASALLLAAIIFTFSGYSRWQRERRMVEARERQLNQIVLIEDRISAYNERIRKLVPERDPTIGVKLENLAKELGFEFQVSLPGTPVKTAGAASQRRFNARPMNQDPELLMEWLARAVDGTEIPGLEVASVKLSPGAPQEDFGSWNLDVEFRRWEREQGTP